MPPSTAERTVTVALLGNPNTGKSTLFTALAGVRQKVGNYPGVTVEKKIGRMSIDSVTFALVDLPGTYSLAPRSPDEMIAVDVLLGRLKGMDPPDAVLCIVDASNLQRNLYLVSQILELGLPTVIALNMIDLAEKSGMVIDVDRLSRQLNVAVVAIQAHRRVGLGPLRKALQECLAREPSVPASPFPQAFQAEVTRLETLVNGSSPPGWPRYLLERLLLDTSGYLTGGGLRGVDNRLLDEVRQGRERLVAAGHRVPAVEATARYEWVARVLDGVVTYVQGRGPTLSDRIDRFLTHRFWGSLLFVVLMYVVFQSVFAWTVPAMEGIESLVGRVGEGISAYLAAGTLQSLLVDGVVAGVGSVLTFLPQIFVLFFFIAILEDCGYMARAAYLMDKLMTYVGLSGKSFIPLLSSFACAIPGIMATRVIEQPRDRLVTILVAPLMSCSARLPVYTLMIGALIPQTRILGGWVGLQGLTLLSMYLLGILAAVIVAFVLNKTIFRGDPPPFVMELPPYRMPSLKHVGYRMLERGWSFVRRAGTLILAVSVVVWAAAYFPRSADVPEHVQLEQSLLGRMGHALEPVVRPLGWDWRIGSAVLASFPAREVVIGTMGVIYNLGDEPDETSLSMREKLRSVTWPETGKPVFTVAVGLSIMVFFALCAQCAATLAVIRRETASWRWPIFTFVYMTTLAYVGAWVVYQTATRWVG